jgi:opacity protein-like surface antigen
MPLRTFLATLALSVSATVVHAQSLQPYIVGEGGGWFGDGGATGAVAVGFGMLTPRNIGFEIEVSYVPGLDFDDDVAVIAIFPPISIDTSGRIIGLQTHVIGMLPGSGTKLRAFVLAGGGVADLERRVSISRGDVLFSPTGLTPPPYPIPFEFDTEAEDSDAVLVLSAGAGFEYSVTRNLALGTSVRYQRLFSEPERLDGARVAARATWRF